MKRLFMLFGLLLLTSIPLSAQSGNDLNEGSMIEYDSTNDAFNFSWWGKLGRTYFIQQSEDLTGWLYFIDIRQGNDALEGLSLTSNADRLFLRLQTTDEPFDDDLDNDGVSNLDELQNQLNPLDASSADGDSMPDDFERFYFGGLSRDGTLDFDNDGFLDADEAALRLNPTLDDRAASGNSRVFVYDDAGRLETDGSATYATDAEGNVENVSAP